MVFTPQAEKDLKHNKLRQHLTRVLAELKKLESTPNAGHLLSGTLYPLRSLSFSLKGSGEYRIIYLPVDERLVCLVLIIGPHENIYAQAERRLLSSSHRLSEIDDSSEVADDPDE